MTVLIVLIVLLAVWHFLVESIIVPSARAALRLRLFALRDELRNMRVDGTATEEEFEEAQRIANNAIRLAPTFDEFALAKWRIALKSNPEMAERIARRQKHFESVASKAVLDVMQRVHKVAIKSLGFNSLGWFIYFVPILIAALVWKSISSSINKITCATEHELMPLQQCPA